MKLVTFLTSMGQEKVGLIAETPEGNQVLDAQVAMEWAKNTGKAQASRDDAATILSVMKNQAAVLPALREILAATRDKKVPSSYYIPESKTKIISPVPHPTSMRDGYAFRQHVEAARRNRGVPMIPEFDHFPIFYFTNHQAVGGPGEVKVQKLARDKLDFELEYAIVIGKECRNVSASQADETIFGFMIMNDWSARAMQIEEMKLNLGPAKGKDFCTSLGPYLVTRDELASRAIPGPSGERHDMKMKAWVNGKQVSEGNTKDMTWTFAQIIERASYGVTLYPGDVIGSGTVGTGCFLELNGSKITDNQWLNPGDTIALEVEGLGRLENKIVAAD